MTDFLRAIESGIKASEDKKRNIQEIFNTIDQIKESIEKFTDGKVTLSFRNSYVDMAISLAVKVQSLGLIDRDKPTSQVLEAVLQGNESKKEDLTIVDLGVEGYPCTIYVDGNQLTALDKEGFEKNLARLLSSPATGSKLVRLVNLSKIPPTEEEIEKDQEIQELRNTANSVK